ncbi:MAG: hypothetical protein WCV90_07190 [Candidatus Woesearchaeota archaeon]
MLDEDQRWENALYVKFSPNHESEYYLENKERIQELLGELKSGYGQLTESLPKASKIAKGGKYYVIDLESTELISAFKEGNWRPVEEIHLTYIQPIQYGLERVVYQVEKGSKILNLWEKKYREAWDKYRQETYYEDHRNLTLPLFQKPDIPDLKDLVDHFDGKTIPNHNNTAVNLRFRFNQRKGDDYYLKTPEHLKQYLSEMKAQFEDFASRFPKPLVMELHDNSDETLPISCFDDLLRARIKKEYIPHKEILLRFREPVLGSPKVTFELDYLKLLRWWEEVKGEERCQSCSHYVPYNPGNSMCCSSDDEDAYCSNNKSMQTNPCRIYEGNSNNHFVSVESIIQQFIN